MTLHTNYENQQALLNEDIAQTANSVGGAIGGGLGGAAGAAGNVMYAAIKKFFEGLGIDFTIVKYVIIAILFLIAFGFFYKIYSIFRPSRFGTKRRKNNFSSKAHFGIRNYLKKC